MPIKENLKSPLHDLAKFGKLIELKEFLEKTNYADMNLKDSQNNRPLYYACVNGHIDVVNYLLSFVDITINQSEIKKMKSELIKHQSTIYITLLDLLNTVFAYPALSYSEEKTSLLIEHVLNILEEYINYV